MTVQPWIVWIAIGIIFTIIEIFTPSFFFLSLGIGAIFTGLLSPFIVNTATQIGLFSVISFISFLILRKISKKAFDVAKDETNIFGMVNKQGIVTKDIKPNEKGYVKLRGEEWTALSEDHTLITTGVLVTVVAVKGNTLTVRKENMNKESGS